MLTKIVVLLIIALGGMAAPAAASAQDQDAGEVTLSSMLERVDPIRAQSVQAAQVGCDSVDQRSLGEHQQYIYNAAYLWSEAVLDAGVCVFMKRPVTRKLSPAEAQRFITATESEFDVSTFPSPEQVDHPDAGGLPSRGSDKEFYIELDGRDERSSMSDHLIESDTRQLVTSYGYPYRNVAMVQTGTSYVETGSAVQITPYVYVTAAHVVVNPANGQLMPNIQVFPANRMPHPTAPLPVASVDFDPTFSTTASNARLSKDLAFLRVNVARPLPNYPAVQTVYSNTEVPNSTIGSFGDPWKFATNAHVPGCPLSWRHLFYTVSASAPSLCIPHSEVNVDRIAVGYPDHVGTTDNTGLRYPYESFGLIWGIPPEYATVRPSQYALPVSGFGLLTSRGTSGGPVFGRVTQRFLQHTVWYTRTHHSLLGVVTNALGSNPGGYMPMTLATGRYYYNQSRWTSNFEWNPNTFWAYPNPVYASGGSGSWTLTWNTPGYSQIDAWGTNSLVGPVEHFLGTAPSPGSALQVNDVGTVARIRFFAHGDYTFPLGTLEVRVLPGTSQD